MGRAVKGRKGRVRAPSPMSTRRTDTDDTSSSQSSYKIGHKLILLVALFGAMSLLLLWRYHGETDASSIVINKTGSPSIDVRFHTCDIVKEFPHDPQAFTQKCASSSPPNGLDALHYFHGLLYGGHDILYESTGLYGQSSVREVHLQTGEVQKLRQMKYTDFGEGLTLLGERLFQVTWTTDFGFIYDRHNLSKVKSFRHPMKDGWGLTTDGENLFGSDGSSSMYYLDPETFTEKSRVTVKYEGHEINYLNELEYVNGEVWANIWLSDCIARISPKDGTVLGWILLHKLKRNLLSAGYKNLDVLNGIAWDGKTNRLFVTGKLWPKLYQIKLRPFTQHARNEPINIKKLCHLKS